MKDLKEKASFESSETEFGWSIPFVKKFELLGYRYRDERPSTADDSRAVTHTCNSRTS